LSTNANTISASSTPSVGHDSRCPRSIAIAAPTVSLRPSRIRASSARQAVSSMVFSASSMRHRHQMVAPEITAFPFNAAFLVTLARRAELGGEPPMRAERQEPHCLLPSIAAQDLAHRARQIVVAQQMEDAAEVGEGVLVRLEERLPRGVQVSTMERRPAGHGPHREDLHLGPLIAEIDPGFISVNPGFLRPTVTLRHERLPTKQTHLVFAFADVIAHRRLSDRGVRELGQDAAIRSPGRVALRARGAAVGFQNFVDECRNHAELRLGAFGWRCFGGSARPIARRTRRR